MPFAQSIATTGAMGSLGVYKCNGIQADPCDPFNTLRPRQNGRLFAADIFKCIFFNDNVWISITISLKFVPKGPFNKITALVQIMAWGRPGDKPLSEPMMVSLLTHICVDLGLSELITNVIDIVAPINCLVSPRIGVHRLPITMY